MQKTFNFFYAFLLALLGFGVTLMAEDITLTTYYPAPYGAYDELTVTGNVGIGTTTPGVRLQVVSADNNNYTSAKFVANNLTQSTSIGWSGIEGTYALTYNAIGDGMSLAHVWQVNAAPKMVMQIDGNVGIGTITPTFNLTVIGTAWVTSGAWTGSDIRWKKNIVPLQGSLDKVIQLKPINFDWRANEFPDLRFSNDAQVGFIAQDVEKIIPEVVTTDNNGYKGISYERITPVLTGAIQEQQIQIEQLKKEIEALKAKLDTK